MRPAILNSWFSRVDSLKGVGPAVAEKLQRLLMHDDTSSPRLRDLLFHRPFDYTDRRHSPVLSQVSDPVIGTVKVKVEKHEPSPRFKPNLPYKIVCSNETGFLNLVFFNARADYLERQYPVGQERVVSGKIERGYGVQMVHPEASGTVYDWNSIATIQPVYPLTEGLTNRQLTKLVKQALELVKPLPEWLDPALQQQRQWPPLLEALQAMHQPRELSDGATESPPLQRLIYDELLASQLALALVRRSLKQPLSPLVIQKHDLRRTLLPTLPFTLTQGQQDVLKDIDGDFASGLRMLRLVQGDVGSGKTVVGVCAALSVIEAGAQVALMVPTEILARQHHAAISAMLKSLGIEVAYLSGSVEAAKRREVEAGLQNGRIKFVVGTHALFQDGIAYQRLGLAIIDEQHRFGVNQRLALTGKGQGTHILLMTATPIPRSLTMTLYGDMDCSLLKEKPAGRQPIATRIIPLARKEEVLVAMQRGLQQKEKIYWICPFVEPKEGVPPEEDVAAVTSRYTEFKAYFGPVVGMAHGRMSAEEREQAIGDFAAGRISILIATTVVEVGVDVRDATIMVIEHAERFGLAQLHQLRGRVGRGEKASACLLLYGDTLSENGKERLKAMRESNDGFFLAEEDLRLRGSGDILGTKQSGLPQFHYAEIVRDYDSLRMARDETKLIVERDPELKSERGEALRCLLYLFEQDSKLKFLRSG